VNRTIAKVRRAIPSGLARRVAPTLGACGRWLDRLRLGGAVERFDAAYAAYWRTGAVPPNAEDLLFKAVWASRGQLPRQRARECGVPFDPSRFATFGYDLLRGLDPHDVAAAVEREGFYVAPTRLDDASVDAVRDVLERGPAIPQGDALRGVSPGPPGPSAPTWWLPAQCAVASPVVQRLMIERRLALAAGRYLGVEPMIVSVALWKSITWRTADRLSAQYFHYDNDRAAFIKMFVYLTDVTERNGAHVYVARSHREKPTRLLHGGRLHDRDVRRFFPERDWRVITGPKGSVFFADTAGFHKGGVMSEGERAVLQINLGSDRFGSRLEPVGSIDMVPAALRPAASAVPRYFSQVFTSADLAP
jgi:hypothetical protein